MSMSEALPGIPDCNDFHVVGNGRLDCFAECKQFSGEAVVIPGAVARHDLIPGSAAVCSLDQADFHFYFLPALVTSGAGAVC